MEQEADSRKALFTNPELSIQHVAMVPSNDVTENYEFFFFFLLILSRAPVLLSKNQGCFDGLVCVQFKFREKHP